ncbi:MAG: hypothetical protein QXX99_05785 [Candidatus Bathyarchaeia archaeon]
MKRRSRALFILMASIWGKVKFHYILIDFEAKPISERLEVSPSLEVLEARWLTPEEIKTFP